MFFLLILYLEKLFKIRMREVLFVQIFNMCDKKDYLVFSFEDYSHCLGIKNLVYNL